MLVNRENILPTQKEIMRLSIAIDPKPKPEIVGLCYLSQQRLPL